MRSVARFSTMAGLAVAVLGCSLAHAARHGYTFHASFRLPWALTYLAFLAVCAYAFGFPGAVRRPGWAALGATATAAGGVSVVQLFVGDALLPRFVVFGAAVLSAPWLVVCARLATVGEARSGARDRVVLVGEAEEGDALRLELAGGAERPATVVAALSVAEAAGTGRDEPLVDRVITERASVLVLTRAAQDDPRVVAQAAVLHEAGVRVRSLAAFYEEWLGKLPLAELERVSLMFDINELHSSGYVRVKRLLDLLAAVVGLAGFVTLVPAVLVGNLVANRGPLWYRQRRVGMNGRPFTIVKLRTMRPSVDGTLLNEWTRPDDPRITPFGKVLRATHLDELPQVLNVLRGDLSVVGPRPEQPHYVAELVTKIPFYELRHLVRPGLTGWAQVKFGYSGDERDALEKLQYEFWYLRHQSLVLDLRIIGRTVRELVRAGGR